MIDADTNAVTTTVPLPNYNPTEVAFGRGRVYVSHDRSVGTVSVVDATSNTVTGSIVVGSFPAGVAIDTRDIVPPVITVPDTVFADGTSPAGAVVTYSVSVVDDVDPNPVLTCGPVSGSVFPLLVTTVSCVAVDFSGNSASATFDVIVKHADWQLEDVIGLVHSWNLTKLGSSLTDKLNQARKFNASGKFGQACDTLASLLNQVAAQTGGGLTVDQATDLITRVTRIRAVIGC